MYCNCNWLQLVALQQFTPKAPPRRQAKAEGDEAKTAEARAAQSAPKPRPKPRFDAAGRGGPGGRGGRGRGAGRVPFEAPRGETFFSGNAPASSSSSAVQRAAAIKAQQDRKLQEEAAAGVRIKPDPDEPLTGASSALTPMEIAQQEEEEAWPPADFEPNAPVALPFGPTNSRTKARLAAQPVFAPAHVSCVLWLHISNAPLTNSMCLMFRLEKQDAAAMEKEEQEDILLLQFPFMIPTPVHPQNDCRFTPPAGAPQFESEEDPAAGATAEDDSFVFTPDMLSLHRYPEGKLGKVRSQCALKRCRSISQVEAINCL